MLLNDSTIKQLIPEIVSLGGWVNGSLYLQTIEIFGILPVPPPVQTAIGMLVYILELSFSYTSGQNMITSHVILPSYFLHISIRNMILHPVSTEQLGCSREF
jgi:hypothetical protein